MNLSGQRLNEQISIQAVYGSQPKSSVRIKNSVIAQRVVDWPLGNKQTKMLKIEDLNSCLEAGDYYLSNEPNLKKNDTKVVMLLPNGQWKKVLAVRQYFPLHTTKSFFESRFFIRRTFAIWILNMKESNFWAYLSFINFG